MNRHPEWLRGMDTSLTEAGRKWLRTWVDSHHQEILSLPEVLIQVVLDAPDTARWERGTLVPVELHRALVLLEYGTDVTPATSVMTHLRKHLNDLYA